RLVRNECCEPRVRIELTTPSLPWKCSATELSGRCCLVQATRREYHPCGVLMKLRRLVVAPPCVLAQPRQRIDGGSADDELEVQVRAVGASGVADQSDDVADLDLVAGLDAQRAVLQVRVV